MRTAKKTVPTLDLFRLAAVLLVVMNHTSPLADVSAMADFWLTRVLARVAVPFFLMTTGYFLSRNHWAGVGRQLKKLCLLYGVCILLYLPVNLYAGSFTGPADVLRKLLVDGTFYHLWYFPATILGIVIARWLSRLGLRVALPVAALLYLIGLGGDSYYGLVSQIPLLRTLYDGIFYTVRLYPQWPVLRATVPSAWGRRKAVEPKAVSGGLLPLSGSHERRRGCGSIAWMSSATTACTSPSPCA